MDSGSIATPTVAPRSGVFARLRSLLADAKATLKKGGLRGLFRKYGWKFFAVIFTYYLVRDLLIYIVIPWVVAKHLLGD